jgi:hypothetical protein
MFYIIQKMVMAIIILLFFRWVVLTPNKSKTSCLVAIAEIILLAIFTISRF